MDDIQTCSPRSNLSVRLKSLSIRNISNPMSIRVLEVVTFDFIKDIKSCLMYCSRGIDFRDNSLSLSHIDDYFMSAIMILMMLREGAINPAKREMRYLIDSSMRYLFVDQQLWRGKGLA